MDQGSDFLKDSFIIETMFVPQISLEEKSKRSPQCLIDSIQVQKRMEPNWNQRKGGIFQVEQRSCCIEVSQRFYSSQREDY